MVCGRAHVAAHHAGWEARWDARCAPTKHTTQVARARANAQQLHAEDAESVLELGAGRLSELGPGQLLLAQSDVARPGGIPLPDGVCDRLVCDLPFGKQVFLLRPVLATNKTYHLLWQWRARQVWRRPVWC